MAGGHGLIVFWLGAAGALAATLIVILARMVRAAEAALLGLALFATSTGIAATIYFLYRCPETGCRLMIHPLGLPVGAVLLACGIWSLVALRRRLAVVDAGREEPVRAVLPLQIAIVAVSAFLLASWGAQVIAAPVAIPALIWTVRSSRGILRGAAMAVLVLTSSFVLLILAYVAVGDVHVGLKVLVWTLAAAPVLWTLRRRIVPGRFGAS